jgi:hypothetical protein
VLHRLTVEHFFRVGAERQRDLDVERRRPVRQSEGCVVVEAIAAGLAVPMPVRFGWWLVAADAQGRLTVADLIFLQR